MKFPLPNTLPPSRMHTCFHGTTFTEKLQRLRQDGNWRTLDKERGADPILPILNLKFYFKRKKM